MRSSHLSRPRRHALHVALALLADDAAAVAAVVAARQKAKLLFARHAVVRVLVRDLIRNINPDPLR